MEIQNNLFQNNTVKPSFGAIKYAGAESVIRKNLNLKELGEFKTLIEKEAGNPFVDLVLFKKGKKLEANISDNIVVEGKDFRVKNYSQRFFENSMNFIKRMVENVKKRTTQVQEYVEKRDFKLQ